MGALLAGAGLTAVVLPLVVGRQQHWPAWTWLLLAAALPLLVAFAGQQQRLARRGGAPLIDPGLFRERAFSVGMALVGLVGTGRGTPAHGFVLGLELLVGCCLSAAALVRFLPGRARPAGRP